MLINPTEEIDLCIRYMKIKGHSKGMQELKDLERAVINGVILEVLPPWKSGYLHEK